MRLERRLLGCPEEIDLVAFRPLGSPSRKAPLGQGQQTRKDLSPLQLENLQGYRERSSAEVEGTNLTERKVHTLLERLCELLLVAIKHSLGF
jgi:hypothetical protein